MLRVRRAARRFIPFALRWRMRSLSRWLHDRRRGTRFASAHASPAEFPHGVCSYALALVCYPGQEASYAGKVHNIALALASVDGIVIAPGETFSFWRCAGRPTARAGYRRAAALKDRRLTEDVGGAICFASTLLYNAGLLGGMEIVERRCHSVDSYGDARYFELGRDAAVEYAYVDLRFRNPWAEPMLLRARTEEERAVVEMRSAAPLDLRVEIEVSKPVVTPAPLVVRGDASLAAGTVVVDEPGLPGISVRTRRRVRIGGAERIDDLGVSEHQPMARRERRGRAPG